jgi:hypothetical protein
LDCDGMVCACEHMDHFIAGDTSGHNNLVGHMNGGWMNLTKPFRFFILYITVEFIQIMASNY